MAPRFGSRVLVATAALLIGGAAAPLNATIITYEVSPVVGNTFAYAYAVENDTLGSDLEEIAVYFDVALFENLRMATAPPDWDPLVIQPDVILPDDGFVDFLAIAGGIAPGSSLGGFTIWADYLAPGTPGRQPFEIFDPVGFTVLDSGFTVPASLIAVPEPTTSGLVWLGIGALLLRIIAASGRRV